MLYREYKKTLFEYYDSEINKDLYRTRNRDNYINGKWKRLCTLDKRVNENSEETVVDLIIGEVDICIEHRLPLSEKISDEKIAKAYEKLLSEKEQEVVSLRIECRLPMKSINEKLNTTRKQTSTRIFHTAIGKIRDNVDEKKGE